MMQHFSSVSQSVLRDRGKPLPVVLVPQDVLRDLPIANDWSEIADAAAENEQIRERVNQTIGDVWATRSSRTKAENRETILRSREAFEALLAALHAVPLKGYDVGGDPKGLTSWLEAGRAMAQLEPLQLKLAEHSAKGVKEVVEKIIEHFRHLIEDKGLWKNLYGPSNRPLHESYAQRLFFVASLCYCEANNVGVAPETNPGGGPVDFLLSRGFAERVVVEMKLSSNPKLRHGYEKQLEQYKRAEGTAHGYYVVVYIGKGERQIEVVQKLEIAARARGVPHSPVSIIDGSRKKSASKI